ncbi:MAG: ABC-type transport auxiliary lipoprotein family protein [Novosphingobium sp.]|nr:ABC-type transport auxiliary lipoprotein family protein [Novosphingobium sp.]
MAIRTIGTLIAASLLLAGCISFGAKLPDQLINLTAQASAPAGEMAASSGAQAIVVRDPETSRMLDVTRVPVQVDASTVAYLEDAVWVERPARLFRAVLAETIRAKGGRMVIEQSDVDMAGKQVLSGRLLFLGYDARDQAVVLRYDALLEASDGEVKTRRFESVIPGIPAEATAVAPALNEAANEVAADVAEWVG